MQIVNKEGGVFDRVSVFIDFVFSPIRYYLHRCASFAYDLYT